MKADLNKFCLHMFFVTHFFIPIFTFYFSLFSIGWFGEFKFTWSFLVFYVHSPKGNFLKLLMYY